MNTALGRGGPTWRGAQLRAEERVDLRFEPDRVGLRQIPFAIVFTCFPFTIVFTCSFVLTLVRSKAVESLGALAWAALVVGMVQILGWSVPWNRLRAGWQSALPLAQMGALVLLERGAAPTFTFFTAMLFIPVVSLALQEGFAWVVVATLGSVMLVWLSRDLQGALDLEVSRTRTFVVPITAFFVALGVSSVTGRLRARTREVLALQEKQADTLAEVQAGHHALGQLAEQLRSTRDVLVALIDAAALHAIIGTDERGVVEVFSRGAEVMLDQERREMVGTDIARLYDQDELRAAVGQAQLHRSVSSAGLAAVVGEAARGATSVQDWTYRRRDLSPVPVQVVVTRRAATGGGGRPGFLFVATDISGRCEAERLQDEFIGLVSHELRTPLTCIMGYLDLLRSDDTLTTSQASDLTIIDRNAQRLLRLVDDLLLAVQLSAGSFTLAPEELDTAAVVRDSSQLMTPQARAGGLTLVVEATSPVLLRSDRERLGQVVENLIGNAVKFTPDGGTVRVLVRSEDTRDGARAVVLEVADTGIGIDSDEVRRISEQFYRARTARSRRLRGIGLGLPIVQAIVDAHGGAMTVSSQQGIGTTFTVRLPDIPA